ncbi:MAG TPA: hypothetical protein VG755_11545 [Nannocystaceae bacterium]|nr:hypothetical protein [Nannocystaceae bacterium]
MSAAILTRAIAAAAIPAAIAVVLAPVGLLVLVPVAVAVLCAFVARPHAGRTRVWLFAMALAAVATLAGTRARELVDATMRQDAWPTFELAKTPMPASPPRWVAVTGVLRDGFVLAEYGVPDGGIPDQSKPAEAVLVPMTGSSDPSVQLEGAIVVARVKSGAQPSGTVTLRGRTDRLPPELLATLVDLGGGDARDVPGVLLDTLAVPAPREAWIAIAVLALLVIGSTVAYAYARR